MSIEKITSKILAEAEDLKAQVLAEAKDKSDAVLAEAEAKAKQLIADSEARGLEEKAKVISRRKSVADIDSRKVILAKKQEIIAETFDKAVEAITAMEEVDYINLLVKLGTGSGIKAGQLIFNEKEKAAIGQKVADALNAAIDGGQFTVADETRNLRGGYMLKAGQTFINNTVEALVDENKSALTGEIVKMLFPA
ncbi:MAG: V-type ATP synthase subunit E [Firmicutes bacterium]|nr:V-type ATP synthase subunit E [Bacillota bacterium]